MLKHDIHIKSKSFKLKLLGELSFNMVSKLGFVGGLGFNILNLQLFDEISNLLSNVIHMSSTSHFHHVES